MKNYLSNGSRFCILMSSILVNIASTLILLSPINFNVFVYLIVGFSNLLLVLIVQVQFLQYRKNKPVEVKIETRAIDTRELSKALAKEVRLQNSHNNKINL